MNQETANRATSETRQQDAISNSDKQLKSAIVNRGLKRSASQILSKCQESPQQEYEEWAARPHHGRGALGSWKFSGSSWTHYFYILTRLLILVCREKLGKSEASNGPVYQKAPRLHEVTL